MNCTHNVRTLSTEDEKDPLSDPYSLIHGNNSSAPHKQGLCGGSMISTPTIQPTFSKTAFPDMLLLMVVHLKCPGTSAKGLSLLVRNILRMAQMSEPLQPIFKSAVLSFSFITSTRSMKYALHRCAVVSGTFFVLSVQSVVLPRVLKSTWTSSVL